ncbi:MAG: metallophosphoesterase [Spirochaetes bacterium]|nr:metallophosphoesterase [Spirochaetota bacterium]
MKILLISDKVSPILYNENIDKNPRLKDIDLILSAGDLPFYYYDFLVSNLNVPLYFVFGNHVRKSDEEFEKSPKSFKYMGGFKNIDEKVINAGGLLIAGLEGSYKYNNKKYQYTEKEMRFKILKLIPRLISNKIRYGRFLDILVVHSPPHGIIEVAENDLAHRGFKVFNTFMKKYKPFYLIHGHIHIYGSGNNKSYEYYNTQIINAYGYRILEITL